MSLAGRVSCSMLNCFGEDGPPSLEYIKAKDLFPQKDLVKEDEDLQVPFPVLQGEGVEFLGHANEAIIAISNYRLHIKFKDSVINTYPGVDSEISVPLRLIENVEGREMFQLHIICKDSKIVRCHFSTFKHCQEWLKRLNKAIARPARVEDLFALAYHAWCLGGSADDEDQHVHLCRPGESVRSRMEMEVKRMGFDTQNVWRVSDINSNFKLCPSYPEKLIVPIWITDKELDSVGSFRSWKRIPVVVYRHQKNAAVIARCSQPEISWWGWRNTDDEYLVTSIAKACQMDTGAKGALANRQCEAPDSSDGDFDSTLTSGTGCDDTVLQKLLILDARSYTAAVANRAKGGGCECEEYYPNCEVMFMGMANIHAIRNSFHALRTVCSQIPDPGNWLSSLESTRWMQHLSIMMKAAAVVSTAVEREGRSVLVHCSDGWDRTPQIVALAKILLDPYYRTIEGFQVLVETEWLDFGHKFGDRCGHQENADDVSEQCPVFLQWLDCVHQLIKQFPCLFEFNEAFLVKLVQHTYSCLYGTFLCNNPYEREVRSVYKRTCSVWSLLRSGNKNFHNFLYISGHDLVLQPVCHTRALQLWTAVYLPSSSPCTAVDESMELYLSTSTAREELISRPLDRLPKTRSMDNLISALNNGIPLTRTSSDPNLNKHCPEGRSTREASPIPEDPFSDDEAALKAGADPGSAHQSPAEGEREETCLTTQPLPSPPLPPVAHPHTASHTPVLQALNGITKPPREERRRCGTAAQTAEPCLPLPCKNARPVGRESEGQENDPATSESRQTSPHMDDSTETLTDETERPLRVGPRKQPNEEAKPDAAAQVPSQTVRGHARRPPGRVQRAHSYRRDAASGPSAPPAVHPASLCASPLPPHVPAYPEDDGLPVQLDAVQQRLRQIEACYKLEVEGLRQQVRHLQMRLEKRHHRTPPSEMDYEDDITCLRESDQSNEDDSLSTHSDDRLSEGSWDRVDRRDTEVTRWVPDHMASHCFNCDSEFWMAKRRHHCRNCGNVFCKDCCHLKLPIPDQQLYDPVLVCNTCHDLLLESRMRDIRCQQLKKPIATASS